MNNLREKPTPGASRWRLEPGLTELGIAGVVLMEIAWFTPWFRYFSPKGQDLGELKVLMYFFVLAFVVWMVDRALRAQRSRPVVRVGALLLLLLAEMAAMLFVFHPDYAGLALTELAVRAFRSFAGVLELIPAELVILLSAIFVFRRGILAARHDVLAPEMLHFRSRLGIVILAGFGLIFRGAESRFMLEALPAYFGAGLLAVAISRVDRAPAHAGGSSGPMSVIWLAVIITIIFVTVGLAQAASRFVQSPLAASAAATLTQALLQVFRVVIIIVSPIVVGLSIVMAWVLRAAADALGGLKGLAGVGEALRSLALPIAQSNLEPSGWLQSHAREIATVGTSLIVALLALTAIRGGRRRDARAEFPFPDEAEVLPWSGLTSKRGETAGPRHVRGRRSLGSLEQVLAATSIRRIYGRVLHQAKSKGGGRTPSETPLEFLPILVELFPGHRAEVTRITHAYLDVQYGGQPDEDAGVAEVRKAWASIQSGMGANLRLPGTGG